MPYIWGCPPGHVVGEDVIAHVAPGARGGVDGKGRAQDESCSACQASGRRD